jgi:integrase
MTHVYAFEHCPLRNATHAVADRSALLRTVARTLWPAARRAERVELSDDGIAAWSLGGFTAMRWNEITAVRLGRTLLGRRTLRIDGAGGRRVQIAPILPGFAELERRVFARV